MPDFIVNKPTLLSTVPVTPQKFVVTANVVSNVYTPGAAANLTISDTNTLSDPGNVLFTIPQSALRLNFPYQLNATGPSTDDGLAVTSVPPGCSILLTWGPEL
jgi:hypothetical protein